MIIKMISKFQRLKSWLDGQQTLGREQCLPMVAGMEGDIDGGEGVLVLMFAGYVPLTSQSPHPILVYFLANYRPHLSHFLESVIFAIPT